MLLILLMGSMFLRWDMHRCNSLNFLYASEYNSGLTESDFLPKEVHKLEESLWQETRSYIECFEEVRLGVDKLIAQGNAIRVKVEDLAFLEGKWIISNLRWIKIKQV